MEFVGSVDTIPTFWPDSSLSFPTLNQLHFLFTKFLFDLLNQEVFILRPNRSQMDLFALSPEETSPVYMSGMFVFWNLEYNRSYDGHGK